MQITQTAIEIERIPSDPRRVGDIARDGGICTQSRCICCGLVRFPITNQSIGLATEFLPVGFDLLGSERSVFIDFDFINQAFKGVAVIPDILTDVDFCGV